MSRSSLDGAALFFATLLILLAGIGWLYWVRAIVANWPGPKLSQALPLDALSLRDNESLVVVVVVFVAAGFAIDRCLQLLSFRRLYRYVGLGVSAFVVIYLANAISLFVVRQIPFVSSLSQALNLASTYVVVALVCIPPTLVSAVKTRPVALLELLGLQRWVNTDN